MFTVTIEVGDVDTSTPEEAADAIVQWLAEDPEYVAVTVEDQETGTVKIVEWWPK